MKNLKTIPIVIFILMTFMACKNNSPSEQFVLAEEVMDIHDEVMPKMDQVVDYSSQIGEIMEGMKAKGDTTGATWESASRILGDLENADAAMWAWMHSFNMPDTKSPEKKEEVMNYLQEQKVAIEKVKTQILGSLREAEGFLN